MVLQDRLLRNPSYWCSRLTPSYSHERADIKAVSSFACRRCPTPPQFADRFIQTVATTPQCVEIRQVRMRIESNDTKWGHSSRFFSTQVYWLIGASRFRSNRCASTAPNLFKLQCSQAPAVVTMMLISLPVAEISFIEWAHLDLSGPGLPSLS